MDLLKFITPIRHNFYENLKADELFIINHFPVNWLNPQIAFAIVNFFNELSIQGLPSLNVGILPSCRGPQMKKNSVNFFCKFANCFCKIF